MKRRASGVSSQYNLSSSPSPNNDGKCWKWCLQVGITRCKQSSITDSGTYCLFSYSLTVFSPSGKLVQIEHALAAVAQGTTSLGIKGAFSTLYVLSADSLSYASDSATNGIVIATEKKSSSLLIDSSMLDKVCVICPNIGIVYSGMGPDYRVLVAKARKSAQAYWKMYGEYPPTRILTQEIATVMQEATQSG